MLALQRERTLMRHRLRRSIGTGFMALASCLIHSASSNEAVPRPNIMPFSFIDNRIFVHVTVDEQGPFNFLIDTGASSTTVSPSLAKRLALPHIRNDRGGGAGEQQVSYAEVGVTSIAVGSASIGPLYAPAFDLTQIARVVGFQQFDGILGTELFQQNVVTIDPFKGRLTFEAAILFRPFRDAIGIPVTIEAGDKPGDNKGMPVFSGTVNGITGRFEVDTGDRSGLTLFGPFWRAHQLDRAIGPTVTAMTGYGVGGPIQSIVGRPAHFTMAGLDVAPPVTRLSLQRSGAFTQSAYAGSIGMGVLKHFIVSFDYSHRMMWLVRGSHSSQVDQYDRSGIWLGLAGARDLQVIDVAVGSPAAQAGIRVGDHIEQIGLIKAGPGTLFKLRRLLSQPDLPTVDVKARRGKSTRNFQLVLEDQITRAG